MLLLLLVLLSAAGSLSLPAVDSLLNQGGQDDSEAKCEDARIPPRSEWYPSYHLSPPNGWMNDPNGLIQFGGWYHAFYQHNPYDTEPQQIHWGHARSKDLVRWEHLPVALAPSSDGLDSKGCFSGSAVDNNGTLTLLYTCNGEDTQVQCIATSLDPEGIRFQKHGQILDQPEGVVNFRDPKVWFEDGQWYMVAGAEVDGSGQIQLYKSPDLHQWQMDRVLASGRIGGYMWECPDFFALDDTHVLLFSPQGVQPQGYLYRNLYQNGYFLGTWSPGEEYDIGSEFELLDRGLDFYAPQTFLAEDGRRIAIGWMDMWETPMPEKGQGWAGTLSLPRELTLGEDGKVVARPVREVETLRSGEGQAVDASIIDSDWLILSEGVGPAELQVTFNTSSSGAEKYGIHLGQPKSSSGLFLYVDGQSRRLTLDRRYPQFGLVGTRSVPLPGCNLLQLRVFFDGSSVEVFAEGAPAMSCRIYPHQRDLSLFADNGKASVLEGVLWTLDSGDYPRNATL